jgi:hypothetical protein
MGPSLDGLEDAFRGFGGVPQELVFDQMKAVITRDLRLESGALVRNLEFLRFAHHWSLTPRACRPYRAQTKVKVERAVRYLRDNFVYGGNDMESLHQLGFVERRENLVFLGPPGVGKTRLAISLAIATAQSGPARPIRAYRTALRRRTLRAAGLVASRFNVKCIRSCRPSCSGCPG